jgi:tRNA(Ile)-lysidine synthase
MIPGPSSDRTARFRADLAALIGEPDCIGLAVSGGPDSLALLLLAAAACPGRTEAVTVDHRLRPESGVEALHVEDICVRLGVPHTILGVEVRVGREGLQGAARRARYEAIGTWAQRNGIGHVATAHHLDDQAETLLMRLLRGSGLPGMSGIRPVRRDEDVLIVRPLLSWTKAELVHLVGDAGLVAVEDPSNSDSRYDRTAARRLLRDLPELQPERLARTATALREAHEALEWAAGELAEDRITASVGEWRVDPQGLPRELQRRLLHRAMAEVHEAHGLLPAWTGGEDVQALLTTLQAGGTATLAGVLARGGQFWLLRPAPPRRPTRSTSSPDS